MAFERPPNFCLATLLGRHTEPVREQPRDELARCGARQLAELAVHVRLVVVAAALGDLGEPAASVALEQPHRALEADQPRSGLGRRPDLLAEAPDQMPPAAPELARELADRQ